MQRSICSNSFWVEPFGCITQTTAQCMCLHRQQLTQPQRSYRTHNQRYDKLLQLFQFTCLRLQHRTTCTLLDTYQPFEHVCQTIQHESACNYQLVQCQAAFCSLGCCEMHCLAMKLCSEALLANLSHTCENATPMCFNSSVVIITTVLDIITT
jgi:hypothetical protein